MVGAERSVGRNTIDAHARKALLSFTCVHDIGGDWRTQHIHFDAHTANMASSFSGLPSHEKQAFFSLLDEYFSSRPHILSGDDREQNLASAPSSSRARTVSSNPPSGLTTGKVSIEDIILHFLSFFSRSAGSIHPVKVQHLAPPFWAKPTNIVNHLLPRLLPVSLRVKPQVLWGKRRSCTTSLAQRQKICRSSDLISLI